MIPQFPKFKPLELGDQSFIHEITKHLPPYSDANFVSLWSWNVQETTKISVLNGNLVINMPDYLTQKPCYFLCGDKKIEESLHEFYNFNKSQSEQSALILLVPTEEVEKIKFMDGGEIVEDIRNHDYVLSVEQLAVMGGNKWRGKRGHVNRFKRLYADRYQVVRLNLLDGEVCDDMRKIFSGWNDKKRQEEDFFENEPRAFERLLASVGQLDIVGVGVTIDGKLEGFTIIEKVNADFIIIHFEKANTEFVGIYTFLNQAVAQVAAELGCKFINYEQDLGIAGLEQAKKLYFPVDFLKKYTVNNYNFSVFS